MLYPLKFHPVYKHYIWGGHSLAKFGKVLPSGKTIAESWEVSAHKNGTSVIANGHLAGMNLREACAKYGSILTGRLSAGGGHDFPLLVKLIGAADNLSVQVHPDDAYAAENENGENGKNEAWLILDAEPGARLIAGVKPGTDRKSFARAIENGSCVDYLNSIPVSPGDVVNIPAGLIHAIGKGIVICEVQQNSDATYRVFDYNRKDSDGNSRPLHIAKALDVINFSSVHQSPVVRGISIRDKLIPDLERLVLVLNRYLRLEKLIITGNAGFSADDSRFQVLTVISGAGEMKYGSADGQANSGCRLPMAKGESVLIPAAMGDFSLAGNMEILRSSPADFYPDLQELAESSKKLEKTANPEEIITWLQGKVAFEPMPGNLFSAGGGC